MKTKVLLVLLVIALPVISYSQIYSYSNINELFSSNRIRIINIDPGSGQYTGSPYEKDEFVNGSLVTLSKVIYKDVPLRLNLYNKTLEYKKDDGVAYELENPEFFEYFTVGEMKIKYAPFADGKIIEKAYLKVLEEGEASMFLRPRVKFEEAVKPGAYQDAKPPSFKRLDDEIYIKIGESEAKPVSGKKALEEIFSGKKDLVNKFLGENKIKYSNPDDILKLVRLYNSN